MNDPLNDLFLVLGIPVMVVLVGALYKLLDVFAVDCFHKWGMWQTIEPKNESIYIQQRFCTKCNLRHISQIKKEKNGSAL